MNITETARSVWLLIFGKKLDKSLVDGNKLIEVWHDIYAGRPEWQTYTTQGIGGRKTVNRYLLNAGKIVTSELAGPCVRRGTEHSRRPTRYGKSSSTTRFTSNMQSWLDKGLALGGGALKWVLRPGSFRSSTTLPLPDFVPVSYDSRGISEADFLSSVVNDGREYRVVEQHRKSEAGYTVSIKVYEKIILGGGEDYREVSPERAGVSGGSVDVPVKLFEAWKNPEANNIDVYSPLGIASTQTRLTR